MRRTSPGRGFSTSNFGDNPGAGTKRHVVRPLLRRGNHGRNASWTLTFAWLICDLSHGLGVSNTYLCSALNRVRSLNHVAH